VGSACTGSRLYPSHKWECHMQVESSGTLLEAHSSLLARTTKAQICSDHVQESVLYLYSIFLQNAREKVARSMKSSLQSILEKVDILRCFLNASVTSTQLLCTGFFVARLLNASEGMWGRWVSLTKMTRELGDMADKIPNVRFNNASLRESGQSLHELPLRTDQ